MDPASVTDVNNLFALAAVAIVVIGGAITMFRNDPPAVKLGVFLALVVAGGVIVWLARPNSEPDPTPVPQPAPTPQPTPDPEPTQQSSVCRTAFITEPPGGYAAARQELQALITTTRSLPQDVRPGSIQDSRNVITAYMTQHLPLITAMPAYVRRAANGLEASQQHALSIPRKGNPDDWPAYVTWLNTLEVRCANLNTAIGIAIADLNLQEQGGVDPQDENCTNYTNDIADRAADIDTNDAYGPAIREAVEAAYART